MGNFDWGEFISVRVFRKGTIPLAVMKRLPSSDLATEDMTNLMIWAIVRIVTLS